MKAEKGKQKGDDPVTAQNKTALQIEQMKDATNKEKNQLEAQMKHAGNADARPAREGEDRVGREDQAGRVAGAPARRCRPRRSRPT